jgi:uncharacterized membrane protein
MFPFGIFDNPFGMVFFTLPILTFILAFLGQLVIRKKIFILGFVFVGYLIATFTLFNSSFLIWCFVYTFLSLIGTFLADLMLSLKKKFTK